MYSLGYIIYYNSKIHGVIEYNDQLLVIDTVDLDNFYELSKEDIQGDWIFNHYNMYANDHSHLNIRNYETLLRNPFIYSLKIINQYEIETGEHMAIDKTYLLKILQKKIRKWLQHKHRINNIRKNPRELLYRQVNGVWSKKARY